MPSLRQFESRPQRTVRSFTREFLENLRYHRGVELYATPVDYYQALALTVREYLMQDWLDSLHAQTRTGAKVVCYLSAEYLPGRQLGNALLNTGLEEIAAESLQTLGLDLKELTEIEVEPGLGNGGLGRLAACFLDSLSTLDLPAIGYGIRYDFGIFRQTFVNGWQIEQPDSWSMGASPWEVVHPQFSNRVGFGGHTESYYDETGQFQVRWIPEHQVIGVPYNILVPGYRTKMVNTLRLWRAKATEEFDLRIFNTGDYVQAMQQQIDSETISKVLYPNDQTPQGKELRLRQQYFFVACSIQDIFRYLPSGFDLRNLPKRYVFQLNDTHPTVAVAEMMRYLMDERHVPWIVAWDITSRMFGYTSHTLLPEALETWPVEIFGRLLPRHMEIIYEINRRFVEDVRKTWPGDEDRVARMSIVGDGGQPHVRMAHLATVGSYSVNGVAPLQSRLLKERTLKDFSEMWPQKFGNVTNGVTPRRFIGLANPRLVDLISSKIGDGWLADASRLAEIEEFATDQQFQADWHRVKQANKADLSVALHRITGVGVSTSAMFDVLVKRIHLYKRQMLKALHAIVLYNRLREHPKEAGVPRVVIFGGKAAPGYEMAKLVIKLINAVADVVNRDPSTRDRLTIVYPPNFNVTLAQKIYAAADISEQVSLAGMEASGTGNMKFAMNGALTVGTLDGANIDIRELVGPENFFTFGMTEEEVRERRAAGYDPREIYQTDAELKTAIDMIASNAFTPNEPGVLQPIVDHLIGYDEFMVLADFASYAECQRNAEDAYRNPSAWTRMSILNTARSGYFSSDRSIHDYADNIWKVSPMRMHGRSRTSEQKAKE
ncbi:MAG: glycogen/starch/alpha-glucan phosphorylase [Thermomicrobiales bacterium]|nr:glycogen/starch/alpha-glucan phosphorylase [Thermomicrobiales bacterium]